MSFNIHHSISPELPLLIMYNCETDQLGISAEGWELVVVINFTPFAKYLPDRDNYREYHGTLGLIGYSPHETAVAKDYRWETIGTF